MHLNDDNKGLANVKADRLIRIIDAICEND